MSFRSRLGAAVRGLLIKSGALDGLYGPLSPFADVYGSRQSTSGQMVTWKTALEVTTVLACARVIAEGVAQIPWRLYQDTDAGRKPAADHHLYSVIYRRPNEWQTSFEFRETVCLHTILTNNAYIFVNRVGRAREVRELIPLEPSRVRVEQLADYALRYHVRGKNGAEQEFGRDAIWHIRGPSWNSWSGMDAVALARNAIGLSMAIESDQAHLYKNGLRTSGSYSVEGNLDANQYKLLRAHITELREGSPQEPLILDRNAKWLNEAMTSVDAQTLESRKLQIEEICRAFRVMPIMIGHSDKAATYASAEQMFLAHVVHTLMPWYERLEQSADTNLLTPADIAAGYYTKFTPNALMRGAAKDRADFYAKGLGSGGGKGWLTQNDVRSLEEMDRSDDPEADELPQPSAHQAAQTPDPAQVEDNPN